MNPRSVEAPVILAALGFIFRVIRISPMKAGPSSVDYSHLWSSAQCEYHEQVQYKDHIMFVIAANRKVDDSGLLWRL